MEIELMDFISESLIQIIEGVISAQEYARKSEAHNALKVNTTHPGITQPFGLASSATSIIDFDVAVTASERAGTESKVGVLVTVLGAAVQGRSDVISSSISRIKFAIPLQLPPQQG
jgi:hypothetical protein